MPRKSAPSSKARKAQATTALPDLRSKAVSKASSQKVRGGGINRIVVTDGKIRG